MKKGIGKALESGIGPFRFVTQDIPEKSVSLLSNRRRLSMIVYLLNYPCAPTSAISDTLSVSIGGVRWHIATMMDAGIVKKASKGYFVEGSIVKDHMALFLALHRDVEHRIMELIVRRGPLEHGDLRRAMGISSQLLSYHMRRLKEVGALRKIGEIYEVAFDIMEFQRTYQKLREEVLARLAMDARSEGVSMEIERKEHFILRINSPIDAEFEVYEVPFPEVLG